MQDENNNPLGSSNNVVSPNTQANQSSVPNPAPLTPSASPEPPTVTSPPPVHPLPGKNKKVLVLVVLFLLAILGGAFYMWRSTNKLATPAPKKEIKAEVPLVRYGTLESPINSFYPSHGLTSIEYEVNRQIFEGLVRFDETRKIVPLLSTGWTNPDPSTWVFEIKQNVEFHTGNKMTAKDVKYSLDLMATNKKLGGLFADTIQKVEVDGDYKVKITTSKPDELLLNKLTFLSIIDSASETANDPVNGTGAYQQKPGSTISADKVELVAFDKYHGGKPLVRELHFISYSEEEKAVDDYKNKKLDVVGWLSGKYRKQLSDEGEKLYTTDDITVTHLGINHNNSKNPLKDKKVREAVYKSIDVDQLMKAIEVAGSPIGQIVPREVPGHDDTIARPKVDIEGAKVLLREAGYTNGVSISLAYQTASKPTFVELARQLKEAGITLRAEEFDDGNKFFDYVFGGTTAQAYLAGYSSDFLDLSDVVQVNFQTDNYSNETINKLLEQAAGEYDSAKRLEINKQISRTLMSDVAWIPLYVGTHSWAYRGDLVFSRDVPSADLGTYFFNNYQKPSN